VDRCVGAVNYSGRQTVLSLTVSGHETVFVLFFIATTFQMCMQAGSSEALVAYMLCCVVSVHVMKPCGMEVYFHSFLTLVLHRGEWLASRPGRFTPGKSPWSALNERLGEPQGPSGYFEGDNSYKRRRLRCGAQTDCQNAARVHVLALTPITNVRPALHTF